MQGTINIIAAVRTLIIMLGLLSLSQIAEAQFGLPGGGGKPRATIKEDNLVRLGDVLPSLKLLQGLPNFDAIGETVKYTTLGNAKYDDVFKEAAEMNAKTKEAKFLVSKYGKDPGSFATNVAKDLGEKAKELMDFKTLLKELAAMLNKNNARASDMLKQLSGLNPADDFSPLDLDAVRKAIEQYKTNLEEVTANAPALIDEIAKLTK
ncbi:MAG: hypothetical protein ACK41G_06520 [Candidatus Thermochlorobacter sp.]